jgi:hypothetical protein
MTKHFLQSLRQSFLHAAKGKVKHRKRPAAYRRTLGMESLEPRQMLSITTLQGSFSGDTGEKPQSKVFEYAGQWWTVMANSSGTSVFRLDGNRWTSTQQVSTEEFHTDIKLVGNVAHILLYGDEDSQLASLQYDPTDNRFEPWAMRPQNINVNLSSGVETATLDVDSTGRMWIASDASNTVEVRYSDGIYSSFSAPITIATGINSDDISAIIAMPDNKIGVLWSNQSTDRFGFKIHVDGAAPNTWSSDEIPARQSALSVGGGMADDHLHMAVTSDGTIYAAVKTSYDKSGYPKIALLVRRPNGTWDNLYAIDNGGTRPIVVVSEAANKVIVAYTTNEGGGDIVYRESNLGTINFAPRKVLISGSVNNVTSTKYTSSDDIVFLASSKSVLFSFDTGTTIPQSNLPPDASAGSDRTTVRDTPIAIDATVTDDGRPIPVNLTTLWTRIGGPTGGVVTFGNANAIDTTATFSLAGTYTLRLTASDGQLGDFDEITVVVSEPSTTPTNAAPDANAGSDRTAVRGTSISIDASVTDDGNPTPVNLTTTWTRVDGPTGGVVTFGNSGAVDTTATFSMAGTYTLRLTANDGQLGDFDEMTVVVSEPTTPPTGPTQLAFQNGLFPNVTYAGNVDTKIASRNATTNYGNATTFDVDGDPDVAALLRWDVSEIPTGSIIVSAAIELNITNSSKHNYEIYALNKAWDELSATWQRAMTGNNWSTAGATNSADRDSTVLGTLGPASTGTLRINLNAAGIQAVQDWINDPNSNFGIILHDYTATDGIDFRSSETSTASQRPKLLINFEPAPEPVNALVFAGFGNTAPSVYAGANFSIGRNQVVQLSGVVFDNETNLALLNVLWTKVSGPGTVTFEDATKVDSTVRFDIAGQYVLNLLADDGGLSVFDEVTVSVT